MFGFSRRRMRIGRLKVQLAESTQGTRSPIRHSKRSSHSKGENSVTTKANSDELNQQSASSSFDLNNYTSGNSENWMVLSIQGENPAARFNHAATVIGNKMLVVGGDSGNGLLEDVQVLNFDKLTWTVANAKAYFSPTGTPLKIPPCRGHCLVSWGKKVLLIGGKTAPASDKLSVWAFDTETNCWSRIEAKGDIPVARIGHSVIRSGSVLILFGGEDVKGRKKSDLHMFDLQSLTWLPLHCTGTGPSARSNHTACLYDDRVLFIFGGTSKSRTLNDLYSLDFETMMWSRMKIRGFHPSARSGSCGVLSGTKWYITGGGSRKKRYAETLVFDVVKAEWSVAATAELSSVTSNKGFSLVSAHHRDKIFLIAYGGTRGAKKEPSNQVEFLVLKNDQPVCHERNSNKSSFLLEQCLHNHSGPCPMDPVGKQNLASSVEHHGSGRKSLSDSFVERNSTCGSISLRKQLKNDDDHNSGFREDKCKESDGCSPAKNLSSQAMDQRGKLLDPHIAANGEETHAFDSENLKGYLKQLNGNGLLDVIPPESETKSISFMNPNIYQMYENKLSGLIRKNGVLEGQLSAALSGREAAEKNLASVIKNRQELERRLEDTAKEMEQLKEKLASMELAHEETNSLSNIVHSDNVRLEHDVAFLKAVLDDTQKELHSTRGVLAGERARAFQLQVEVFHLKQRFQTMENRAPTPRKPFPV